MKRSFFSMVMFVIVVVVLALPCKTLASESDTLVVYASGPPLDEVINSDTTATGVQAHSVYKLVSLDTTYIFLGAVLPKSDIIVIGVLGPDRRPPCIQPGVLSDGSIPSTLFDLTVKGLMATFKNLYILDLSTNGSWFHPGYDIVARADSMKVYADNVIFDFNHGFAIAYTGNWCSFFITNCKFRNGVDPVCWTDSEVLAPKWPAAPAVDSVVMKYNTFFCQNAYACVMKPPARYLEFCHNSVVFSFLQPLFVFPVFSAKINDNLFYGAWVGGHTKEEYPWWFQMFSPEVPAIIDLDTMNVASAEVFDPEDAGNPDLRMLAEAKRTVEVKNNVYFQPQAITDFWTEWNNTYSGNDSLYTPVWMNTRTTNMFNNKTTWPGFTESGNMIGVDPLFGSSFANVLDGGGDYGLGLLDYFTMIRTKQSPTIGWGYQIQSVSGDNWIPYWPLPEAADMQYTNASLKTGGTDGKPIGDPGWFTGGYTGVSETVSQVPDGFALYDAYPNPFNPTTQLRYSLPRNGFVTLKVYDVLGQEVATLVSGMQHAGDYTVSFDGSVFASGVYFYRLESSGVSISKKMMLLK